MSVLKFTVRWVVCMILITLCAIFIGVLRLVLQNLYAMYSNICTALHTVSPSFWLVNIVAVVLSVVMAVAWTKESNKEESYYEE